MMTYCADGPRHGQVDAALLILPGRAAPVPGPRIWMCHSSIQALQHVLGPWTVYVTHTDWKALAVPCTQTQPGRSQL